jgi:hypothetical protein
MTLQYLAGNFPDQGAIIVKLRASDPTFDGICADFEEITTEIVGIKSKGDTPPPPSLCDLTHTLEALRIEIEQYLKHK